MNTNTNQHFYACLLCRIPTTDPVMICPECRRRAKLGEKMEKETPDLESNKSPAPVVPAPDTDHCPVCGAAVTWVEIGDHQNVECSGKKCTWWMAESLKRMGTESIPALSAMLLHITRVAANRFHECEILTRNSDRKNKLLRRVLDWANGGMKNWAEIMPDIGKELDL